NDSHVLGSSQDFSRSTLLQDTNEDRISNGQTKLRFNGLLNSAAQAKAEDLASNNYWAHISTTGKTPWNFITNSGYYYQKAGENLAYGFGSANDVVQAWLNSPEHKDNMLNKDFEDVGFGIAESNNYLGHGPKVIVVAEYAEPVVGVPVTTSNPSQLDNVKSVSVTRIELWTNPIAFWSVLTLTVIGGVSVVLFAFHHALSIKKLVREGEVFVLHHPFLDVIVVFLLSYGLVLTRSTGVIN
ncbi:MAG TPA: CAP domain-containing protein, partial [Patescibacteria group bacterium]|nr:CAP domain-containing protein [Patescibacteria group bacterium]